MNQLEASRIRQAGTASVGGLFRSRAEASPAHPAIVEAGRQVSYRECEQRSNAMAAMLRARGVGHGDRVALLSRNCLEYVELELAAAKCGAIIAALNWRLGTRELAHCITLVSPTLLIMQAEFDGAVDAIDGLDVPRLRIGTELDTAFGAHHGEPVEIDAGGEDGLIILYTSGTTGLPKGALVSHRAMVARAQCYRSEMDVPVGDNFVAWAPMYHMASTDHMLATLMSGGTVYPVDGYDADRLIDVLETVPMRYLIVMPGMVGDFASRLRARKAKVVGVGICGAMADLVPADDIAAITAALDAPYLNTFGATETGFPPATGALLDIGVPPRNLAKRQSAFCEIKLVDPEGRVVPVGEPGEVAVRGPTVFSGYWENEETNLHDFRDGWFHMGDVLRRNPDGTLDYVDRVKYLIKSGGENIYPAEVEAVLKQHPAVAEAVVVRQADPTWGEVPVAFIVTIDDELTVGDLEACCREALARYKHPKQYHVVPDTDIPRSTTGKIQRHHLESRLRSAAPGTGGV
ncbi:MAG: AMP-binding protein [Pseudomonadota bacterium]